MEQNEQPKAKGNRTIILITIVALIAGFIGGQMWTKRSYSIINTEEFKIMQASYNLIEDRFLYDVDSAKLLNGAITGMVQAVEDPYTQFLPDQAGEEYVNSYEGSFYGIGAEISQINGRYFIASLVKDMPAEQSGLLPDDEIVEVDGEDIAGYDFNKLLYMVRGEKGTKVVIGVKRGNSEEIIPYEITRAEIPVYTVYSERLEQDLGLITVTRFAQETANEFKEALNELQKDKELNGLIIDLRSNPGGLLEQTRDIASMLMPKDMKILDVVYKDEAKIQQYKTRGGQIFNKPIVVLINEYSASASEVLSAALKENIEADIVGVTSYGKGVVQQYIPFHEGSVLVLTEAEWKTPLGNGIHGVGVEPTHVVDLPEYAKFSLITTDEALQIGSYGDQVQQLEQYLQVLGYMEQADGLFDEVTKQALMKYEAERGLPSDGIYDIEVGSAFVKDIRELLEQNDTQLEAAIEVITSKISE